MLIDYFEENARMNTSMKIPVNRGLEFLKRMAEIHI
jgi:hypothetical protein